jgi:hypothetical protein
MLSPPRPSTGPSSGLTPSGVLSIVRDTVAAVLGPSVPDDAPLMSAGLDSLGAVELRSTLEARLGPEAGGGGLSLPPTLVFDYPSATAIAGFISSQLGAREAGSSSSGDSGPADGAAGAQSPVPVARLAASAAAAPARLVGVAGTASRTPRGAISSAGASALAAADAVTRVPLSRWDWDWLASGAGAGAGAGGDAADAPARFGGWLAGIEAFDAAAFGISGAEAELMDAQQRLLLEGALEAAWGAAGGAPAGGAPAADLFLSDACVAVGIARCGCLPACLSAALLGPRTA